MSALLTTDYLAAEALTICQAAGRPELEIQAGDSRYRDGRHCYTLAAYDPCGERNPLDCHCAFAMKDTAEAVLAELAQKLGCAWPIQFATTEQRQELVRLGNHQFATRTEKTALLLNSHQLSQQQAAERIAAFRTVLEGRYPSQYAVVAGVEIIRQQAA